MSDAQRTYYGPDWLPAARPVGMSSALGAPYCDGSGTPWLPPGSVVVMHPDGCMQVIQPRGVVPRYAIRAYEATQKLGDERPPIVDDKA